MLQNQFITFTSLRDIVCRDLKASIKNYTNAEDI